MTVDNSARGRLAQAAGQSWEDWIEVQHEKARWLGILAHVTHNQAKTKVICGQLTYEGKGDADYTGTLDNKVATTYAAEAKSVSEDYLPYSMIEKRQAEHLDAVARAGGLALLLARFRLDGFLYHYAIPWLEVPWAVKRTAKSINTNLVEKWLIPCDPTSCFLAKFYKGGVPTSPPKGRVIRRD